MPARPCRRASLALVLSLCTLVVASRAAAFSGGITTQSFGASGCNECHTGGLQPPVMLTGPMVVDPGSTNEYTLVITERGQQDRGGLNVSSLLGTLMTGGAHANATQVLSGTGGRDEITHTGSKAAAGGAITFSFLWTAPMSFSTATLDAWGNDVNGNFSTTGDRAAHTTLTISNSQSAPTPTGATPTPSVQPTPPGLADPIHRKIRPGAIHVTLEPIASGMEAPVWASAAPGVDPKFIFVVDQAGNFWRVDVTTGAKSVFLDVSSRLVPLGVFGPGTYDERGFLGAAFDPEFATNGLVYTYTSEPELPNPDYSTQPAGSPPDHQSNLIEWHVPNPTDDAAVVDPNSARVLLRFDEPQFNHNGGCLNFGADGMLYISTGDGGGADDQDDQPFIPGPTVGHSATGNGQRLSTVLGKILRIDPHGNTSANAQYGLPPDNPFLTTAGAVPEIWAYGFRNPFRFSFDTLTHALYAGDVGQNDIEEIDVVNRGGNYGWHLKEGTFFFFGNGTAAGYVEKKNPDVTTSTIDPVAEYDHDEGIAVQGGFVYRGTRIPKLEGHYVFGEFAKTFANDGRLFYLRRKELVRAGRPPHASKINELRLDGQPALGLSLLGIGSDANGEIYMLGNTTAAPAGGTGVIVRLGPPSH